MAKFKSPFHISRMKIIDKYDRETQLKMKKEVIHNYCDTITSLTDSIRQFNDMGMTTHFLKSEQELISAWSEGLQTFLKEWEKKYE